MKKSSFQSIALAFLVTTFFFSCGKGKQKQIDSLKFDKIEINETAYLLEESDSPGCNLVIDYTYPVSSSDNLLADSVNKHLISVCFGEEYSKLPIETVVDSFKNEYIRSYKKDLKELYLQDKAQYTTNGEVSPWYSYYHQVEAAPVKGNSLYITYKIEINEYTGGAHGLYSTIFQNFIPTTGELLNLNSVFKNDYEETLNEKLLSHLMKMKEVTSFEELQELGYFLWTEIYPSTNFLLGEKGIEFFYNVYEIAPYAAGVTTIILPYRELKDILEIKY